MCFEFILIRFTINLGFYYDVEELIRFYKAASIICIYFEYLFYLILIVKIK